MNMADDLKDDGGVKKRVTVSLDPEVAVVLKAAADHAGASVSAYVQDALRDRLRRDEWLERWRHLAGDVDSDALAYARRALAAGSTHEHPRAS